MGELQATLEIQVELGKFYNVDLFQRGYYQIRTSLKTAPKVPIKTEVSLPHNSGTRRTGKKECDLIFPASIINGVAVSKTFQILYRNEDVIINDIILFKVHLLADAYKVDESVAGADIQVVIELWFSDDEFGPDQQEKLNCISTRTLKLNIPTKGVHHHVPILFDYFHLSAVTVTIHATLLALSQPYLNLRQPPVPGQQPPKQAWTITRDSPTLETILFGTTAAPVPQNHKYAFSPKLEHAYKMHKTICNVLLSVYESLQTSYETLMRKLPKHMQVAIEHVDCHQKLERITGVMKKVTDEETLLEMATSDIAQLCAENVILWSQYLELVMSNDTINHILAKEHHSQRIKRFSEGFFTNEFNKQAIVACYEPSVHGHGDLAALVKTSPYFQGLLPLPMECWDMDGDHTTLPIIFEDIYCEASIAKYLHTSTEDEEKEDKAASELSSSGGASSLTRKGSRHSDTSSQYSSDSSSPRMRKNKRKFIKNIKPEAFKRPSSFMMTDGAEPRNARGSVAVDPLECSLVGYRKLESIPSIPDVELGTLSPGGTHDILSHDAATKNALYNAVSMPTLLAKGHVNMATSGSLPDLTTEPLLDKSSIDLTHMIQAGLTGGGSDSALASETSSSQIQVDLDKTIESAAPDQHDQKDSGSSSVTPSDSSSNLQNVQNGYITSESDKNSPSEPTADTKDKVDYNNIAQTLTDALGEPEIQETDTESAVSEKKKAGEVTSQPNVNTQSNGDKTEVVTGDLAKTDSEANGSTKGKDTSSKGGDTSVNEASSSKVADASVCESSLTKGDDASVSESSSSKGGDTSGLGESASTLHSQKEADTMSMDSKPKSDESDEVSLSGSCTLMELLKEEYERSERAKARKEARDRAHPAATSTTSLSSVSGKNKSSRGANRLTHGERLLSMMASSSTPDLSQYRKEQSLVSPVGDSTINFITAKENLRRQMKYSGHIYSDFPSQVSTLPYFWTPEISRDDDDGIHLIVCVHGLDGNSADLRLIRTYLEMALPNSRLDFLMSERNQPDTFADFEVMTDRLVDEVLYHIELYGLSPSKISFVGHSLGNLIIRSVLSRPKMAPLLPKLHTFLSLSGPHLGTLYNTSGLVNMGMWFMQKWKKSGSLLQLSLKDHADMRQTFLYQLSTRPGLEFFKNILLVGSSQDRYVPFHSTRIELCKAAAKDSSTLGAVYSEMVNNILQPIVYNSSITFIRYDVFHALPNTANSLIGRAAHIAVLDSELFIEKFITVSALKYFK